jgi:hypothetical protein
LRVPGHVDDAAIVDNVERAEIIERADPIEPADRLVEVASLRADTTSGGGDSPAESAETADTAGLAEASV